MRGDSFAHLGVGVRRSCWSDARDECLSSSTTFVPSVAVPSESVENVLSIAAQPSSQVAKSLSHRVGLHPSNLCNLLMRPFRKILPLEPIRWRY